MYFQNDSVIFDETFTVEVISIFSANLLKHSQ